jgi:hypothetical protein
MFVVANRQRIQPDAISEIGTAQRLTMIGFRRRFTRTRSRDRYCKQDQKRAYDAHDDHSHHSLDPIPVSRGRRVT